MSPAEALRAHEAKHPEMPRGLPADHPDFIRWHAEFSQWVVQKERLEIAARVLGVVPEAPRKLQPACTSRADYHYREPLKRRSA